MDQYSPRERVLLALEHQEPDRVPLDTWMSSKAIEVLCRDLNLPRQTHPNGMWHEGILQRLRVDIRRPIPVYSGPELKTYSDGSWDTPMGIRRKGIGYGHPMNHPLAGVVDIQELLDYPYPAPDWYDFTGLQDYCRSYSKYLFIGGSKFPLLHDACDLMGMEQVMINFFEAPDLMHALFDRLLQVHLAITQAWIEAAPESIDVLIITDDYGANHNMLMSPRQWRTFLMPRLKSIVEFGHEHGMKVMLHSDGSIRKIIPDLIEMGIDILNPIEPEAEGMEPTSIKRDFGASVTLHGAASSINLAHAAPNEIRAEVEHLITNLAPGGGFILCPSNHIMEDMPVENVLTFYDVAYEFGRYV